MFLLPRPQAQSLAALPAFSFWSGHKGGVHSSSEICPGGHASREGLPAAAHHRLLHPKPGTQEDLGEDSAHAVC